MVFQSGLDTVSEALTPERMLFATLSTTGLRLISVDLRQ